MLWLAAVAATAWSFGFTVMSASDLWWHLAAGRLIRETGRWPATDPWSFTRAGAPWLHHEWLADVVYDAWARAFGMEALVWWKWLVLVTAFALLFRTLARLTKAPGSAYLATLLAVAVGAPFFDIRPHLYSVLGYVVVLRVTFVPSRARWALPAVFLVCADLHGGFFFGLMVLAVVLGMEAITGGRAWPAVALWIACAIAALVTPNGVQAFAYPLKYAFDRASPFRTIAEWLPPFRPGGIRSPLYIPAIAGAVAAGAAGFALGIHREQRRSWLAGLVLSALTLAMSLQSRRFIPLFGVSLALVVAPALAATWRALVRHAGPRPIATRIGPGLRLALPLAALAIAAVRLAPYPISSRAFGPMTGLDHFPVDTIGWMEANALRGNVFAYWDWGGYLHLRTDGRLRVFIDGRADTVFDTQTYRDYVRVLGMGPGWMDVVESSAADYVLWPLTRSRLPTALLGTGRWRLLYQDHASALLVRSTHAVPEPLRPSPESAHRRLTLGVAALGRGRLDEAETHFRAALERDPGVLPACYGLARVRDVRGEAAAAADMRDRCEAIYPGRRGEREPQ